MNRGFRLLAALGMAGVLWCGAQTRAAETVNLLKSSSDLTTASWKGFLKTTNVTAGLPAPDGGNTAFRLEILPGGFIGQILPSAQPGKTYLFSVYVKSATGSGQKVTLAGEVNVAAAKPVYRSFQATGDWARVHLAYACPPEGNKSFRFSIRSGDILVWHPLIELVRDPAAQPSEYVESVGLQLPPLTKKPAPAPGVRQNMACWGDSLTQGAGGKPYPEVLRELPDFAGVTVFNGGIGGQTSKQIRQRFLAAEDKFGDQIIIWAGRNNYSDPDAVLADVAAMVEQVKTDRYLVLTVLNMNTEVKGSGSYNVIMDINRALLARYGEHCLDIRQALVNASDSQNPQDSSDRERDVPPNSLRSDGIHLNAAGYRFVAEQIANYLRSHQWLALKQQ